jgi:hypothetical protein
MTYGTKSTKSRGRVVAPPYKYLRENGVYLATKVRDEFKNFWWYVERDGQQLPLDPATRDQLPLYQAHKLVTAEPEVAVWFCEGEKDADRLTANGLLATSAPHGALGADGQVWKDHYLRPLRKRDVVYVLEDNDEAGRVHTNTVAAALFATIPDVRAVRLPGLHEHGDVSDWLDAGHTIGELVEIAEATPRWEPPEWPTLSSLRTEREELPDLPTECLPRWLADWVNETTEELQTQRSVPGLVALATVASTVACKVVVHVKNTWFEPLNLYCLTVLGPGNRKTAAFKAALAPLRRWEREVATSLRDAVTRAQNALATAEMRRDDARRKVRSAPSEVERRELEAEAEALALKAEEAKRAVPHVPTLVVSDVTEEALGASCI